MLRWRFSTTLWESFRRKGRTDITNQSDVKPTSIAGVQGFWSVPFCEAQHRFLCALPAPCKSSCQDAECFTRSQDTSSIAGHFCLSTSDCKVLPDWWVEMWRHKFSQCWSLEVVNTTVYVGSVSWAVRHQSAALLDGPGRMYAFSMQAESLGRKQHIIDILRILTKLFGSGWFTTWRGMYTICYCEQECLGSGWGVDLATKCYTSWRFRASHHRHDLGIPSSGCFVDGNKVLPSCSVEFTSMAVGGGAIATPHLASFSRASLRFVPSVRKGRMWS